MKTSVLWQIYLRTTEQRADILTQGLAGSAYTTIQKLLMGWSNDVGLLFFSLPARECDGIQPTETVCNHVSIHGIHTSYGLCRASTYQPLNSFVPLLKSLSTHDRSVGWRLISPHILTDFAYVPQSVPILYPMYLISSFLLHSQAWLLLSTGTPLWDPLNHFVGSFDPLFYITIVSHNTKIELILSTLLSLHGSSPHDPPIIASSTTSTTSTSSTEYINQHRRGYIHSFI